MSDANIGQILQAFNSIESKLQEQNVTLKKLTAKVDALESQNKQLVQLVHQLRAAPAPTQPDQKQVQFQNTVTQGLKSIEDKSKKALELIKSNSPKKRAWP